MTTAAIATALRRARDIFTRRPSAAVHADAPATARWQEGLRFITSHANGKQVSSDMPEELGGTGDQVTPGWLMRAGLASCLGTVIAMQAAAQEITLTRLEVHAHSTSDARGMLGMSDASEPVSAAPSEIGVQVTISASNASRQDLEALVHKSFRSSPVPSALTRSMSVGLLIQVASN